ncbi:pseudaminic acid cytidylyltransferase [Limnobacter sp.]|uniref:pseudaminic acid cytidylyltransferase n=1 Tax=Limnobacter sp. TaxID=2003368 RepID=UPI002FE2AB4F
MKVAIIPARGGSKRIPGKNVKPFCGKPMIAWSIQAALQSGCFDRVLVSTDSHEIASCAEGLGAEIPFIRPAHLSDDHTPTIPVVQHAINFLLEQGAQVQQVCCVYATAPFIQVNDLQQALNQLQATQADYVFSATTFTFPIQRAIRLDKAGCVAMFYPEHASTRSQDLEEAFHDAGQFYWGTTEAWLEGRPIFGAESGLYLLPRSRVQDIDTPEDWVRAELMFRALDHGQ